MARRFRRSFALAACTATLIASQLPHAQQVTAVPAGLTLRSFAAVFAGDGASARVRIAVDVTEPSLPIADASGRVSEDLICDISAVDPATGQTAASTSKAVRFLGGVSRDPVTLDVDAMLTLNPGKYEIRTEAKSRSGTRSGSTVLALDIPDSSRLPLRISDLVLGSSGNPRGWSGSRVVTGGTAPPIWPFHPEISREFASTDDVRVYAEVARANPASAINASAEILDRSGRIVVQRTPIVAAGAPGSIDTTLTLQWLAPGSYRVRVTAKDEAHTAAREVEFVVK
jgi:hypothetical protein